MKLNLKIKEAIDNSTTHLPIVLESKKNKENYNNFFKMIDSFEKNLNKSDYKSVEKKIIQSLNNNIEVYCQVMSELIVVYYILTNYNFNFKYEPKYNGGYNPECSFTYNDFVVNLEVKCPDYTKMIECENRNTIKIDTLGQRLSNKYVLDDFISSVNKCNINKAVVEGIEKKPLLDNKLKDYLEHSQKKFPSGEGYFNILVISLEIISDLDEWFMYLFGDTGVFSNDTFVRSDYSNVDAILLTTIKGSVKQMDRFEHVDVWNLENTHNFLFLDPRKQNTNKSAFYCEYALKMFGDRTCDFLNFYHNIPNTDDAIEYYLTKGKIFTHYLDFINGNNNFKT